MTAAGKALACALLVAGAGCSRLPGGAGRAERDVSYGPHASDRLDVYWPEGRKAAGLPAVLVFHGGGWREGRRKDTVERVCGRYLRRGYVVVNADYRLAAEAQAPAAAVDAMEAADWLRRNAGRLGVDPERLVATGESAGGHLALMAALAPAEAGLGAPTRFAAAVSFSGIADVADLLAGANARDFAAGWCGQGPGAVEAARRLSPRTWVRPDAPPVIAVHADSDPVVPYGQASELISALRKNGGRAELVTIRSGGHGFEPSELEEAYRQVFVFLGGLGL